MLVAESEGTFDGGVLEGVVAVGERSCRGDGDGDDGEMGMEKGLREVVRGKVEREGRWRGEGR